MIAVKFLHLMAVTVATSTALGVFAAPAAATNPTCTSTSPGSTICSRPGGSTAITATPPPVVGPYDDCGYGVGMEYMCNGGVSWNMGGIFNRNRN